jgi:hypothetical protein
MKQNSENSSIVIIVAWFIQLQFSIYEIYVMWYGRIIMNDMKDVKEINCGLL